MEVTVHEREKRFDPITLTVRLQTAEEAAELWHRLNINLNDVMKAYTYNETWLAPFIPPSDGKLRTLWAAIEDELQARA